MFKHPIDVKHLKSENEKNHLIVRQKLIDAAEGRLSSVTEEFERAFDIISKYPKTVTMFGSARLDEKDPVCKQAFAVAWALAKHDYTVVTGGGGGVMQAANHGAQAAGGASIGFNIHLPMEQQLNPYTTDSLRFEHFFGRKVAMTLDASAYVYFGGGFGTMDELFEILTLMQNGIIPRVPIVLVGVEFWGPFDDFIRRVFVEEFQTIDPIDAELYTITDDVAMVLDVINNSTKERAREEMEERARRTTERWKSYHESVAKGKKN